MKIKNIIFDFGGVLIDWNPRNLYKDLFDDKSEMEFFLKNVCNEDWNLQQDAGRSLSEGTKLLQNKFPEYKLLISHFYDQWESMLNGEIKENVDLIPILKKEYKLYGLTNWSNETIPIAMKKYGFFKLLDGIVVSGVEKMVKPNRKISEVLLNRYHLVAEESIFIDDNLKNIEAAKEIGFHCIHYSDGTDLKVVLKQMNILNI